MTQSATTTVRRQVDAEARVTAEIAGQPTRRSGPMTDKET
jgi:hypothetical protein